MKTKTNARGSPESRLLWFPLYGRRCKCKRESQFRVLDARVRRANSKYNKITILNLVSLFRFKLISVHGV